MIFGDLDSILQVISHQRIPPCGIKPCLVFFCSSHSCMDGSYQEWGNVSRPPSVMAGGTSLPYSNTVLSSFCFLFTDQRAEESQNGYISPVTSEKQKDKWREVSS